ASPVDRKEVTKPNLSTTEKPLRFEHMSGLDGEQLSELENRVAGLLETEYTGGDCASAHCRWRHDYLGQVERERGMTVSPVTPEDSGEASVL
ncbi:MAG TPA: hypothetical protein VFV73_34360, partial [Streptosporangiaceae bacterium]|nr:hypothetical protein [Streptosporangiaceae bacterium]